MTFDDRIVARLNVRGQSLDQIAMTVAAYIDTKIESVLEGIEDDMRAWGATDEEVDVWIRRTHLECLQSRRDFLASLRVGLREG